MYFSLTYFFWSGIEEMLQTNKAISVHSVSFIMQNHYLFFIMNSHSFRPSHHALQQHCTAKTTRPALL